jgi:hypothetical protein
MKHNSDDGHASPLHGAYGNLCEWCVKCEMHLYMLATCLEDGIQTVRSTRTSGYWQMVQPDYYRRLVKFDNSHGAALTVVSNTILLTPTILQCILQANPST